MEDIDTEKLDRHTNKILMFSGGKDSLVCLYLLKEYWTSLIVVWINTGDAYPETLAIINKVRELPVTFIEIKSDVKTFREIEGSPTDILSIRHTSFGLQVEPPESPVKMVSAYYCCQKNIWEQAVLAVAEIGATLVIRGERGGESLKTQLRSGQSVNGAEYYFPIWDWTQTKVIEFLKEKMGDLPEHIFFEESSLDCMGCTAYTQHTKDRKDWMKKNHPLEYSENRRKSLDICNVIKKEIDLIERDVL